MVLDSSFWSLVATIIFLLGECETDEQKKTILGPLKLFLAQKKTNEILLWLNNPLNFQVKKNIKEALTKPLYPDYLIIGSQLHLLEDRQIIDCSEILENESFSNFHLELLISIAYQIKSLSILKTCISYIKNETGLEINTTEDLSVLNIHTTLNIDYKNIIYYLRIFPAAEKRIYVTQLTGRNLDPCVHFSKQMGREIVELNLNPGSINKNMNQSIQSIIENVPNLENLSLNYPCFTNCIISRLLLT